MNINKLLMISLLFGGSQILGNSVEEREKRDAQVRELFDDIEKNLQEARNQGEKDFTDLTRLSGIELDFGLLKSWHGSLAPKQSWSQWFKGIQPVADNPDKILWCAVRVGNVFGARLAIIYGADVNKKYTDGNNTYQYPLFYALKNDDVDMGRKLIEAGADVKNDFLLRAHLMKKYDFAKMLIEECEVSIGDCDKYEHCRRFYRIMMEKAAQRKAEQANSEN